MLSVRIKIAFQVIKRNHTQLNDYYWISVLFL